MKVVHINPKADEIQARKEAAKYARQRMERDDKRRAIKKYGKAPIDKDIPSRG